MGSWGFYAWPSEPHDQPEIPYTSYEDVEWWEEMAEANSRDDFIERELSYENSMEVSESIATDEGGWGAWMGGEL